MRRALTVLALMCSACGDARMIIADGGPADASAVDASQQACGRVRVEPPDALHFPRGTNTRTATVTNIGACALTILDVRLAGSASSADDFTLHCPCAPLLAPGESFPLALSYLNNDISNVDFAEMHIVSNDQQQPDYTLVLSAEDDPCLYPVSTFTFSPLMPAVGMPIMLDASGSAPGGPNGNGATITVYEWSFEFSPGPAPTLSSQNTVQTSFTPVAEGLYIVGLRLKNSCGAETPAPATENITVR